MHDESQRSSSSPRRARRSENFRARSLASPRPSSARIAVREAVRRAAIDPAQRRRVPDGMRARRGPGPKPRSPSGFARWSRRYRLRHDPRHGVRLGPQSGRARRPIHRHRQRRNRRRRRHGVHVQRAVSSSLSAQRLSHGRLHRRRLHDPRRPVVRHRRLRTWAWPPNSSRKNIPSRAPSRMPTRSSRIVAPPTQHAKAASLWKSRP